MNSFLVRAYGIIRRPRATFAGLVAVPTWIPAIIATTAVTFVCTAGFLRTDVGRQALVDQWERTALAFGRPVDDAGYSRMEEMAADGRLTITYATATTLAGGPALTLTLATLLYVMLNRGTGPRASYRQVLAVVCYAAVILALRQVVATPIDYVRESTASPTTAGLLFSMVDETSIAARFLGIIDLFVVWWLIVLAIGVATLYRRSARPLLLAFAGVYIALALTMALAMAAAGGTT